MKILKNKNDPEIKALEIVEFETPYGTIRTRCRHGITKLKADEGSNIFKEVCEICGSEVA